MNLRILVSDELTASELALDGSPLAISWGNRDHVAMPAKPLPSCFIVNDQYQLQH